MVSSEILLNFAKFSADGESEPKENIERFTIDEVVQEKGWPFGVMKNSLSIAHRRKRKPNLKIKFRPGQRDQTSEKRSCTYRTRQIKSPVSDFF